MAVQVTRTITASITNHRQVQKHLDTLGKSASKIWNIARWTADRIWDHTKTIPDEGTLKAYMKNQPCWKDLNAYSSQKVIEELSDAFQSWFEQRETDTKANPPGYRKHGDTRPKSTITFKSNGFKHDEKHNRIRLSKGNNNKQYRSDFILCEYQTRNDNKLENIDTIQTVRAVWTGDEWQLHFVCKQQLRTLQPAGEKTAGVDLGVSNIATVAFPEEYVLYPGNKLKEDQHYFSQEEYTTEGENGPSNKADRVRRTLSCRETHFYHVLSKEIIEQCVSRNVGTLVVGWPEDIREQDYGRTNNKWLHNWAFDRLYQYLAYKGEEHGVTVVKENEWGTSKTCCSCGCEDESNRVTRGLYVCDSCDLVANADCNAAENIRQKEITPSHSERCSDDRSNGCLAQPSVRLFDTNTGRVRPQEQVVL